MRDAVVFCEKCHKLVYLRVKDGDKMRLVQGNRTIITTSPESKLKMKLKCPAGHEIQIGGEAMKPEEMKPDMDDKNKKMEEHMSQIKADMEAKRKEMEEKFARMKSDMESRFSKP